ncbi:MAG: haloacid dehalogenase type II [Deltaproteobacteria bacterium]|nr:haloacid dehalogenase type II [Deltaproteobacteria bacterium]
MLTMIAFDVYGTLVNPLAMADHLKSLVGDVAGRFAELWRTKQLEYSFRRALMHAYQPFSVCTWEALVYTEKALGIDLAEESRANLMQYYSKLPPFPEAAAGLASLKKGGHFLAAFSNGEAEVVRDLLENAKLLSLLDDVISADEVKTFKPDPALYAHAVQRLGLGQAANDVWLVSSNPFDIIGAKSAGLHTAWVRRDPSCVFDPWRVEPDLVMSGLDQLAPLIGK